MKKNNYNFEYSLKNLNYQKYFEDFKLNKIINTRSYKKGNFSPSYIFDNNNKDIYPPDLKDLIRLHFIVTSRKILNVLEFGVGFSTLVLADALRINKEKYSEYVKVNLRKSNPFKLYSVDSNKKYITIFKKKIPSNLKKFINLSFSSAEITTYNDQICSKLNKIPNVNPELIYVDGPSFLDIKNEIDGIHFRSKERTVLNCNVLKIEHLLMPGTLIIWDGQTNNARFNACNFKRNWVNKRLNKEDISFSEQIEEPLGYLNKRSIDFSKSRIIKITKK